MIPPPCSDTLLRVEGLTLRFRRPRYIHQSLREKFVAWSKSPFKFGPSAFDESLVLNNLSFSLQKGDRVGILGRNGQGKTTLCKCLAGFFQPTQGEIIRYGQIRGVFDTGAAIYPDLTGRENARLLAHFLYPNYLEIVDDLLEDACDFSGLGSHLDTPYRLYSNGMQSRLFLSLISCLPAEILILDEVFDGADKFFREKISNRVLSMVNDSGGVIFVSHSLEQINQVCNRVIVLFDHQIVYDGDVLRGIATYLDLHQSSNELAL